jgi:hypothetical protein
MAMLLVMSKWGQIDVMDRLDRPWWCCLPVDPFEHAMNSIFLSLVGVEIKSIR